MIVFHNLDEISKIDFPSVITLGNFDAIHIGHQEILRRCVDEARRIQGKSIVVTYDHQSEVLFKGNLEFVYLNNERMKIFESLGLDYMVLIPFTPEIKEMPANIFLQQIILGKLNAALVIIGYDHRFGKNREGDLEYLKKKSIEHRFGVIRIEPVMSHDRIVSSSRIRSDLVMGEIVKANEQLGSPFHIDGKVVHGFDRGQLTGFPTANIEIPQKKLIPADGVYLGQVEIQNTKYPCVMNIGNNPTFNNTQLTLEVHILDFHQNIYDKNIRVFFLDKIRNEIKFENVKALKSQISHDIQTAKKYFKLD